MEIFHYFPQNFLNFHVNKISPSCTGTKVQEYPLRIYPASYCRSPRGGTH